MVLLTCKPGKVNVLVIDDEPLVLDTFEAHFKRMHNISIDTSIPHTEFIDIVKSNKSYSDNIRLREYDWIFIDCDLESEVDGKGLYMIIRENDPVFAEKIILMSVHKNYIVENFDLKVYSKFDEILKDNYLDNIESSLVCGRRP